MEQNKIYKVMLLYDWIFINYVYDKGKLRTDFCVTKKFKYQDVQDLLELNFIYTENGFEISLYSNLKSPITSFTPYLKVDNDGQFIEFILESNDWLLWELKNYFSEDELILKRIKE